MTINDTSIDDELAELGRKLTCTEGRPATDDRFPDLLKVIRQVRVLNSAVPFTTVACTRVDLAVEGVFGKPARSTWRARTQTERMLATRHVYEVLFAALAAGFTIVAPEQQDTCEHARGEQPGTDDGTAP